MIKRINRVRESKVGALNSVEVFVGSVGYNDNVRGAWIPLPIETDDLNEVLSTIRNGEEDAELAIIDVECESAALREAIYSNGSIYSVNGLLVRLIEDYIAHEVEDALLVAEIVGVDIFEALEAVTEGDYSIFHCVGNAEQLGREYVDEGYFGYDIPDDISIYFDYDALGEELMLEGWVVSAEHEIAVKMK